MKRLGSYAIYVRVSTDRDEQVSSVENQIDICRNWLERNGFIWDEKRVFKDEGISGTLFVNRPAIQLLLQKAKAKEIDMVVFKSISRLARDLKDSLEIREVLLAHNVRIISVEEGYDSVKAGKNDMAFELWSLFSAQYSRTLSSSITAALAVKVRRGEHIGKVPFGYNRENQKLVIHDEEAEIVQKIYSWYTDGWGYKKITNELNRLGVKSKTKKNWQMTSVQRILRNPIYKGTFILNQYTSVKVSGKKKQIRNPKEKWFVFPNHHPAIIDEEVWNQVNPKDTNTNKTKITAWNEFRNLAKCAVCSSNMVIVQSYSKKKNGERTEWKYLKCSQYRRAGKHGCVNHVPIQYRDFRQFIIDLLVKKGESVTLKLQGNIEEGQEKKIKKLQQLMNVNEQKKKALLDLYLEGLINKEEFEKKRNDLEAEITKANHELFILQQNDIVQTDIKTIKEAFEQLRQREHDLYHVFQTLIQKIVIHQDGMVDITYTFESPL
ncbi:recombinase family protein [Bacillus paranthracis]|uniref:DNA recombinase, putative n=1 Tax=Bacillus cereus (strain Q1) TaxID=361100 RepID=B9IZ84_BACCQ|nr:MULTISPECIES: recombinase family protein [Bacillus cereus group]ACM14723.1 DNA recombinase, putative [Bacillus cereus Q1]MBY5227595.1 serine recombinase [Bacillus paranthracis]MCY9249710.1 recombinase family protein [Bacillus paranthracis]MDA1499644.1 recombinase family protein [Bacillus cereus group sp. TH41-1LC]MDA1661241.1 recombinase family protein [Bacillus cereus group sp. TH153LC]